MAASIGALINVGAAASGTTATERYKCVLESLRLSEELLEESGFRGSRSHDSERVVQNNRGPGCTIRASFNSVELDTWLPRILGGTESVDVFPLAETLPEFSLILDLGGTARWYLSNCKVDVATFAAQQRGLLEVTMQIEALDFTTDATAFATLSISTVPPYLFSESASGLIVNSLTKQFREMSLEVNNMLVKDRYLNSQTRVSLPEGDRVVTWRWNGPYGDNSALFALAATGVPTTATFTKGARSLLFSSAAVSYPREFPQVQERNEIMLGLEGVARMSGSTKELVCTNDSAP